jgi:pimeloyl-ACP methyl ester carboxylesterase
MPANTIRPGSDLVPDRTPLLQLDGPLARRHRVTQVGHGPDVVIFSHGLGTDQSAWAGVIADLPPQYTAVLFDLPGAGPLLPADFNPVAYASLAQFADDIVALLDEIGVTRCRYVGHSVSGMIGVLAAIEAPELFDQLILLNASPRYLNDRDYVGGFDQSDLDGLFGAMADNYQGWVAGFAPLAIAADAPGAVLDFSNGLLAMRPDVTLQVARAIFQSDVRRLLPQLTTATVLVHTRNDIAVPGEVARYLNLAIAGSRLVWIEASGHLPHLSAPAEVSRVIYDHLA